MKRNLLLLIAVFLTSFGMNAQITSVAIVGEAVGGWPGDPGNPGPTDVHQMTSTDGENWTIADLVVTGAATGGGAKFRANNAWDINWGSNSFPSGIGTQGGDNILTIGGTYTVNFNSTTGAYEFVGGEPISVVTIAGTAVTPPEGLNMTTTDGSIYTGSNITLIDGQAQFSIDGVFYGGITFPNGSAIDPGSFIPVVAGTYSTITYNIDTGDYSFVAAPVYPDVAIVGPGAGGWPPDPQPVGYVDPNQLTTTDGITYTGTVTLTADFIKFRQNNTWIVSWGGVTFPTGPIVGNNENILVTTPGTYDVTFSYPTGNYSFTIPTIAIVGDGTLEGWPTDPQVDPNPLTTTDGRTYTLNSISLVSPGNVKLRSNNSWEAPNVNYGGIVFPSGIATPGGGNIAVPASGDYGITFDRVTGELTFSAPLATNTFNASNFGVYPNPTNSVWNFTSGTKNIESINIIDVLGKTVMTVSPKNISAIVDASALNTGIYFARIATADATTTVKLVKN